MSDATITSFYTSNGSPITGLTPTIRIWDITTGIDTLVVVDQPMTETGDGFYKYIFTTFNPNKKYTIRTDGGITLNQQDRYQSGSLNGSDFDELASDHMVPGSLGEKISQIKADTFQISVNLVSLIALIQRVTPGGASVLDLLDELLKYDKNRTRIDKTAKTLTVYDNDAITPLRIFDLKDEFGIPSIVEVIERDPQ